MKRMLALLLGILLAFSFALAEDAAGTPAETEPAETAEDSETTEDYMVPRMFMSMFNSVCSISAVPWETKKWIAWSKIIP